MSDGKFQPAVAAAWNIARYPDPGGNHFKNGASYDAKTIFTTGFDPAAAGMISIGGTVSRQ